MLSLEDEIYVLDQLDEFRIESAMLRERGREALAESLAALQLDPSDGRKKRRWEDFDAPILEAALSVRALTAHAPDTYAADIEPLIDYLIALPIEVAFGANRDEMPILRAARAMHALLNSRQAAFSRSVMYFHYRLVREIYSAHPPEWVTGGTRAGETAMPTAYATGEAIRAISGLKRALERRAEYAGLICDLQRRWERLHKVTPEAWRDIEAKRLAREFFNTIETQKGRIGFATDMSSYDGGGITGFITSALARMALSLDDSTKALKRAYSHIDDYRKNEFHDDPKATQHRQVSESAHLIAHGAVKSAIQTAEDAQRELAAAMHGEPERLTNVQNLFLEAAKNTAKLIQPAVTYVSRVLDRELAAAASNEKVNCDPPELAFAAASYGAATNEWHDERLRRAALFLSSAVTERGRFPLGRPLRSTPGGYKAHVIGSEVIRAFSQLLENIESVEVEPRVTKSLMMYFHDTEVLDRPGVWQHDEPVQSEMPRRWGTAFAVLALDRINRMLDARINAKVLKHFSWRKPGGAGLPDLFYGDYGLVAHDVVPRESVAITLERMRGHIRGLTPKRDGNDPIYSLVLHGPPGTGKTTMVEALAQSAGVRLVEVTPSDIVLAGVDQVERRARAVFKALSLLTRVVIMFDEFDPVLQARDPNAEGPPSVFSFLTPGMLPKLKTLHDAAKKRSLAYVLITNLVGTLDEAAIREGRFDARIGVYPPDLLSRLGRLRSELDKYERPDDSGPTVPQSAGPLAPAMSLVEGDILPAAREARLKEIVVKTAGMSMNTLGKRGWFTAPEKRTILDDGSAMAYLLGHSKGPFPPLPHPYEVHLHGRGPEAEREWIEANWVHLWDENAKKLYDADGNVSFENLLDATGEPDERAVHEEEPNFVIAATHCRLCMMLARMLVTHHAAEQASGSAPRRYGPRPAAAS